MSLLATSSFIPVESEATANAVVGFTPSPAMPPPHALTALRAAYPTIKIL
jgi:hypothetical protein